MVEMRLTKNHHLEHGIQHSETWYENLGNSNSTERMLMDYSNDLLPYHYWTALMCFRRATTIPKLVTLFHLDSFGAAK